MSRRWPGLNDLDAARVEAARAAGRAFADRHDLDGEADRFCYQRCDGRDLSGWPTLHIEDLSALPFVRDIPGIELYQHRARVRAVEGDLFTSVVPATDGYEDYCGRHLGLGRAHFVPAEPDAGPMAVALGCMKGAAFETLMRHAQTRGGLVLHPYMAIEPVWELAAALRHEACVPTCVMGPPPPVMWAANDKAAVTELVRAAAGEGSVVRTRATAEPGRMVDHMLDLARDERRVGLKRTRCVSAMGNRVFDGAGLLGQDRGATEADVARFLSDTEWQGDEEVLVVQWVDTVASPSTQLWLPPPGRGPPVVQGVFEQILEGEGRVFVGSRPSRLGARVDAAAVEVSLLAGAALQAIGYVGRCSFDLLITGDPEGDFSVVVTECNGRWGGASTPMALVDRLVAGHRPAYRAQDFMHPDLRGARFTDVLERLDDLLYDPRTGRGHLILYNVGPLDTYGKLDVIALAPTPERADELVLETLPHRLGLSTSNYDSGTAPSPLAG